MSQSNKIVTFITDHQIGINKSSGVGTAAGASTRLRALIPGRFLASRGWQIDVQSFHASECVLQPTGLVVVSKIFKESTLEAIRGYVSRGHQIISDHCDNYLESGEYSHIQLALVELSVALICNTEQMARMLRLKFPLKPIFIIEDTVEGACRPPRGFHRKSDRSAIEVLSFGNRQIISHLAQCANGIKDAAVDNIIRLTVVTLLDDEVTHHLPKLAELLSERVILKAVSWHQDILDVLFSETDVVFIPSVNENFNFTKSPNRLLESIWAGVPVVGYPLPTYLRFKDFVPITPSLSVGLKYYLDQPEKSILNLCRAQELVKDRHSPEIIGLQWDRMLRGVMNHDFLPVNLVSSTGPIECFDVSLISNVELERLLHLWDLRLQAGMYSSNVSVRLITGDLLHSGLGDIRISESIVSNEVWSFPEPTLLNQRLVDLASGRSFLRSLLYLLGILASERVLESEYARSILNARWLIPPYNLLKVSWLGFLRIFHVLTTLLRCGVSVPCNACATWAILSGLLLLEYACDDRTVKDS